MFSPMIVTALSIVLVLAGCSGSDRDSADRDVEATSELYATGARACKDVRVAKQGASSYFDASGYNGFPFGYIRGSMMMKSFNGVTTGCNDEPTAASETLDCGAIVFECGTYLELRGRLYLGHNGEDNTFHVGYGVFKYDSATEAFEAKMTFKKDYLETVDRLPSMEHENRDPSGYKKVLVYQDGGKEFIAEVDHFVGYNGIAGSWGVIDRLDGSELAAQSEVVGGGPDYFGRAKGLPMPGVTGLYTTRITDGERNTYGERGETTAYEDGTVLVSTSSVKALFPNSDIVDVALHHQYGERDFKEAAGIALGTIWSVLSTENTKAAEIFSAEAFKRAKNIKRPVRPATSMNLTDSAFQADLWHDRPLLALASALLNTDVSTSADDDAAYSQAIATVFGTVPTPALGDLTGDGLVDAADSAVMFASWGQSVTPMHDGDLNGDGVVDAADAAIMFASWSN